MPYHSPYMGFYGSIPILKNELKGLTLSSSMAQFEAKVAGFDAKVNPQSTDFISINMELLVDNNKRQTWVDYWENLPTFSQRNLDLNGLISVQSLILETLEVSLIRSISSQAAINDTSKTRLQLFELNVKLSGSS